jgi:hypothetical protein
VIFKRKIPQRMLGWHVLHDYDIKEKTNLPEHLLFRTYALELAGAQGEERFSTDRIELVTLPLLRLGYDAPTSLQVLYDTVFSVPHSGAWKQKEMVCLFALSHTGVLKWVVPMVGNGVVLDFEDGEVIPTKIENVIAKIEDQRWQLRWRTTGRESFIDMPRRRVRAMEIPVMLIGRY